MYRTVGIHDADKEHMPHKTFPNYALMKISAFYKSKGAHVEWWNPLFNYDAVFSSKVFDFTPENPYLPPNTIKGGTGYNVKSKLSDEIDLMFPDYSIYPECDYAVDFLTRGCIRNCVWCGVPEKEGWIHPYRTWQQVVRNDTNKLVLMDNNILAHDHGITQLGELSKTQYKIDINQGMDARLVTSDIVKIFKDLNWIRFIRFSCDMESQIESIENVYKLFQQIGVSVHRLFVYTIVRKDLQEASRRIEALKKLHGINIYAQAEQNFKKGIVPNAMQKEFARRYVYSGIYRTQSWDEYCEENGLKGE